MVRVLPVELIDVLLDAAATCDVLDFFKGGHGDDVAFNQGDVALDVFHFNVQNADGLFFGLIVVDIVVQVVF